MKTCEHCVIDPHTHTPRPAIEQVRGVWLCQHHRDVAVIVGERLLRPDTARENQTLLENLR